MQDKVVLQWTYSPADYFEGAIEIAILGGVLRICEGKVAAEVSPLTFDADENYRLALHAQLKMRFLSVQVIRHRTFTLSPASMTRYDTEGRRGLFLFPEAARCVVSTGNPDIEIKDKDGTVISSTRNDRDELVNKSMELAALHADDPTLKAMFTSYAAAVCDPDDELIHLFEIIEIVSTRFGSRKFAEVALGFPEGAWSPLGKLANEGSMSQGRHRGRAVGAHRRASLEELNQARSIVRLVVSAYMTWLNSTSTTE